MHYEQLMAVATLASYATASTAAGVCLALVWLRLKSALTDLGSVSRPRVLVFLRLAPALIGCSACVLTILAFLRYEPRSTAEVPGSILVAGAAAGAGLFFSGFCRIIARCWSTYRFLQTIERTAIPIRMSGVGLHAWQVDTDFPLIALAGIWRSRLLIARSVLEQIPGDELQIALKHELAHARHHDNLTQLLVIGLPDVLSLAERRLGIERAWREAAEDAADDFATRGDTAARVCLASALIRVARMVGRQPLSPIPLLAFHGGESIERRVRRLVDVSEPRSHVPWVTRAVAVIVPLLAASALLLKADIILRSVHHVTEWLVNVRL